MTHRALILLIKLEWSAEAERCPICHAYRPGSHFAKPELKPARVGHDADCELAAVLGAETRAP